MVPGFFHKMTVFLDRLMPRAMQRMIFGRVVACSRNGLNRRVRIPDVEPEPPAPILAE